QGTPRETPEVSGEHSLGAACLATDPYLRQMRHQHLEAHDTAFDALLWHLNSRDVPGVVQNRRRAVTNFANGRDWYLAPDVWSEAGTEIGAGQALEALEVGAAQGEADGLELGPIERAGRARDTPLDL